MKKSKTKCFVAVQRYNNFPIQTKKTPTFTSQCSKINIINVIMK